MKNSLKNKIKYDYEEGTEIISTNLWDKLEAKLDATENIVVPENSTKLNLLKYAAVLLGIILLGFLLKYNVEDISVKENIPAITKVNTPAKTDIQKIDTLNKFKDVENQSIENQEFVQTQSQKFVETEKFSGKSENFSSHPPKVIQDKKEERSTQEYIVKTQRVVPPIVPIQKEQIAENKTAIATTKPSTINYVKADELLFGRELHKTQTLENLKSKNKLGVLDIENLKKPSSIKFLGFTIYSDSTKSN